MFGSVQKIVIPAGLLLLLSLSGPALADIYRYRDEYGVWHFTNIKKDFRYKIYIRTPNKSPSQYIKDYEGIIQQAATRFRLDSFLIKAVIKAESDFDQNAVSTKGAQGLMQLMPETANDLAVEDPFNPEENIFGGTRYLGQLMQRFKQNWQLAIAAYNAGPENVEAYNGIPPFDETQTFVKRVMSYYDAFTRGKK
jgi:soluble lytic murein transglycosylase-like protein